VRFVSVSVCQLIRGHLTDLLVKLHNPIDDTFVSNLNEVESYVIHKIGPGEKSMLQRVVKGYGTNL